MLPIKKKLKEQLAERRYNLSHLAETASVSRSYLMTCINAHRGLSLTYTRQIAEAATQLTGHYYHYSDFMPPDDGGWETDYYQHESRALRKVFDCWLDGHTPDLSEYTAEETIKIYALFERVKDLHREAQNLEVHTTLKRREI
jgi:AraC-like DNA-binding protein